MNQLRMILRHRKVLRNDHDDTTARDCVSIAASSINAIHSHHTSPSYKSTDRFSSVLYLVNSLLPLVCVIVRENNQWQTRTDAIAAFQKCLSILQSLSQTFSAARHILHRLDRIIISAKNAIRKFEGVEEFTLDLDQFDASSFMPNMAGFFSNDFWKDPTIDPTSPRTDALGSLMFNMNDVQTHGFPSNLGEMNFIGLDNGGGNHQPGNLPSTE